MNELKVFEDERFDKIRIVEVNDKIHFVASDIAKALKYHNTSEAISDYCR